MKLPRRVPWSSIEELETIYAWIYTDENDLESKIRAINRLSAWRAITHLPHALESTLSLLVVIAQDQATHSQLSLRQSYSTAIIRLVNGLVDPLQHGAYARSIASIANQLGLPTWLVELRHAATHEDLPGIELLREAAREAMNWLLNNYFLPTTNPSSINETQQHTLRSVMPILKRYKTIHKITIRDVSLTSQYKTTISTILKDVERWIAEAKVAANVAVGEIGWDSSSPDSLLDSGEMDAKEKWALEKLCDALLQNGALVPLSKRKRDFPVGSFSPPEFSLLLWNPLLHHLQTLHTGFLAILVGRIISHLLSDPNSPKTSPGNQNDLTYDLCLARWAVWCINAHEGDESQADFDLKKEVTITLMRAVGHSILDGPQNRNGATALLESLCSNNSRLETILSLFLRPALLTQTSQWDPNNVAVMEHRLHTFMLQDEHIGFPSAHSEDSRITKKVPGPSSAWRILNENSSWRPCPVGIHYFTSE
ncbi:Las1-like-domain-containing protein [Collybia nuda]|uniref:Las1-like-domain-containing protein n=1 Tax=Collybia nuda TaxID=64659 RepID=A0A9P5XX89_9AGAR|nr:Las1-like-domain-containing protein [Collybia nuda]